MVKSDRLCFEVHLAYFTKEHSVWIPWRQYLRYYTFFGRWWSFLVSRLCSIRTSIFQKDWESALVRFSSAGSCGHFSWFLFTGRVKSRLYWFPSHSTTLFLALWASSQEASPWQDVYKRQSYGSSLFIIRASGIFSQLNQNKMVKTLEWWIIVLSLIHI